MVLLIITGTLLLSSCTVNKPRYEINSNNSDDNFIKLYERGKHTTTNRSD